MTRIDAFVVGTLVVLFALIAGLVGVPSLVPAASSSPPPTAGPITAGPRPYREGVLGHPSSVSPLSAKTQADRDLVALVYSGLVRNGPAGSLVPDLAERWTVDPTGAVWTFELRTDARWHDGEPVTADDVAYTVHVLQDPSYTGPGRRFVERGGRSDRRTEPGHLHPRHPARRFPAGGDAADRPRPPAGRRAGRRAPGPPVRSPADRLRAVRGRQPERLRGRAHPGRQPAAAADRGGALGGRDRFARHGTAGRSSEPAGAVPVGHRVPVLRHPRRPGGGLSRRRGRRGLRAPAGPWA